MDLDVTTASCEVLVDVKTPQACAITLDAGEALDLADKLVAAAVDLKEPAVPSMLLPVR